MWCFSFAASSVTDWNMHVESTDIASTLTSHAKLNYYSGVKIKEHYIHPPKHHLQVMCFNQQQHTKVIYRDSIELQYTSFIGHIMIIM